MCRYFIAEGLHKLTIIHFDRGAVSGRRCNNNRHSNIYLFDRKFVLDANCYAWAAALNRSIRVQKLC